MNSELIARHVAARDHIFPGLNDRGMASVKQRLING
jgi:hypothetical protein